MSGALAACGGASHSSLLPVSSSDAAAIRTTQSASSLTSPSIISAGDFGKLDSFTTRFKWMTTQDNSPVAALTAAGDYSDFYISALRELPTGGTQPDWSTVNLHEDAFLHAADPATLTLQPASGAITLHWNADARTTMGLSNSGYAIYKGTSAGALTKIATVSASTTSYTVSGLSNGTKYYFSVHSLIGGSDSLFSWVESAVSGAPSTFALYSPTYTTSVPVTHGATVSITVSVHATGASLPSSLKLQTLVNPGATSAPASVTMSAIGGGVYHGTATVTIPSSFYGGIAFRIADASGNALLPSPANQTYYATTANNRMHFGIYPNNYLMDPGSAMWQSLLATYISSKLTSGGFGGVLLDDYGRILDGARPEAFPPGYTTTAYLNERVAQLSYLRSHIPSSYDISVNGFNDSTAAAAFIPYCTRGEIEEIAYDRNSWKYAPLWYWTQSLDNVLSIQGAHPTFAGRVLIDIDETATQARLYSTATYLLLSNGHLALDLETPGGFGKYLPEYDLALGTPTQTFAHIADAWVAADGAYERSFSGGRVIVNPTTTETPVIKLGQTYNMAVLTGGADQDGGTLTYKPVTTVQLSPDEAAILVLPTGSSTATPTPAPSPTATAAARTATFVPQAQNTAAPAGVFSNTSSGSVLSAVVSPSGNSGGMGVTVPAGATVTHGWIGPTTAFTPGYYSVYYSVFTPNANITLTRVEVLSLSGTQTTPVTSSWLNQNLSTAATYHYSLSSSQTVTGQYVVRFTLHNAASTPQTVYINVGPQGSSKAIVP